MFPVLSTLDTDVSVAGYPVSNIFFVGGAEEVGRYVEGLEFCFELFRGSVH
jgi:hypothetical protein